MKTICMMMAFLMSLVWMATSSAMDVKFQWDPNTEPDLAGYKIYYGVDDLANPLQQDVSNQTVATISGLDPDRNYTFAVVAYNTSGLESSYSNIVQALESVLPVVSITAPLNNAKVSNTASIFATASDNVGVTKVEFYLDGNLKATQAAGPYQYSWNTLAVATGTHTITAKAYDAAGNVGVSTVSVNVVNDLTPPVITNIAPAQGSSVNGVVAVSADASDDVGVAMVEFYVNGVLGAAVNVPQYGYGWDTTTVANGLYALTVKAYDGSGKATTSSAVNLTVNNPVTDNNAPGVNTFTMPTTATSLTVAISSFTASDAVGVTGYLITEIAKVPIASASGWTASAPTSFTFSSAGSKTAYAWAKDAAGNISASRSAAVTITLPDTTTPAGSTKTPAGIAAVTSPVAPVYTISDALLTLRIAVGTVNPTAEQRVRADVAPVDGKIDISDALGILRDVVGAQRLVL